VDHRPSRITTPRARRPAVASTRLNSLTAAVVRRGIELDSMGSEQGQTLVEFALILPILLLLVIGIFDFGSAFNSKNELNFLANTAARYAEVNSCAPCTTSGNNAIANYVASTSVGLSSSPSITFCLPNGAAHNGVGDPLQVTASAPFNWLAVSLPGLKNGGQSQLSSTVTVRILQAPDPTGTPPSPALYNAPPC